jgi:hypothetical protein
MSDDTQTEVPDIEVMWREVPTIMADVALGHARAGGVVRIVMGEVVFNETPDADMPRYRPVFNMAVPVASLDHLIDYLQGIKGVVNGDQ